MNKISVILNFFIAISCLLTFIILFPFFLGVIVLGLIFGGLGSGVLIFHSVMHKLHFCPLCGVFPSKTRSSTSA